MAIEIKEYIGSGMSLLESTAKMFLDLKEGYNTVDPIHKDSIMQEIEGIHVGPTRNFTWYTEEALDSSIHSWTKPYQRPLIMHHNEKDGKIIGRVMHAEKVTQNTRSGTPAIVFTCNVPDKDGKEQILDGRLKTTSIGVIAHDVRCSICKEQVQLDESGFPECGHMRGNVYKEQVCYWMIYKMEAKELSYVIVPSDVYAHNTRTYKPDSKDINIKENLELKEGVFKDMAIDKTNIETTEGQTIDETVKEGAKVAEPIVEPVKEEPKAEPVKEEPKEEPVKEEPKEDPKDAEISKLKEDIKKLEENNATIAKDLAEVKVSLANSTVKVEKTMKDLGVEVALKESVEEQLIAVKTELREATEESFNSFRTLLNKPIMTAESLSSRNIESIKDSIADLKEEMKGLSSVKQIAEATDPTLQIKETKEKIKENKQAGVKESNSNGNIDLEEGMQHLMSKFLI